MDVNLAKSSSFESTYFTPLWLMTSAAADVISVPSVIDILGIISLETKFSQLHTGISDVLDA